jgi:hypothetical protein
MSKNQDPIWADGFSFKRNENAPDFVVGNISVNIENAKKYFDEQGDNGWVNFQVKQSSSGNYYCEHDTWKPTKQNSPKPSGKKVQQDDEDDEDLPF